MPLFPRYRWTLSTIQACCASKLPHVLGGAEADPVTQLDVLEEVSRIDPAAGWCLMIGAASLGGSAAFLPDDAIDELFEGGKPPRTAGAFAPYGKAIPVAGGYRRYRTLAFRQRACVIRTGFLPAREWWAMIRVRRNCGY